MTRPLLFLLLLLGQLSYGQTTIRGTTTINTGGILGDSINNSPNISYNDRIKLIQIDKSPAKVDIRLYCYHSLSNTKSVCRLFLIDTTWKAVEFDEWNKPKRIKKYNLKAKSDFDSIFIKLLSFNIMTLPNQSELKNKMRKNVELLNNESTAEKEMHVSDGEVYTIEIKIGTKFRVYQFDNPEAYAKFYYNVSEIKDYLNIVQTFDNCLKRK
jgi:hypothetical protein